jgi:flagellar basal-body rod modification protein FlgD
MTKEVSSNNPLASQVGSKDLQTEAAKKRDTLGQEDFLKLLIAQIKNQSPLKPQENGEFLGQMAQFSTVSGLQKMQQSLDTLTQSMTSNQALQASSLVGRNVLVPSSNGYLPEGTGDRFFGAVDIPASSGNAEVQITNGAGTVIKNLPMGNRPEGLARFAWDGTDNNGRAMPPGNYKMVAIATVDGKQQSLATHYVAPVESVTLGRNGGKMTLNVAGVGSLGIDEVKEIFE